MAVEEVFGGTTAWVSDIDPGASKILAHHWPDVPNLGDLTTTDWRWVVDTFGRPRIVCGGYPCQPFSTAGLRKGTADARHIWPDIARALGVLRPRIAVFENVAGHLRLGFDTVLADLAGLGFDVEWCVVRASEVGAPHQRKRLIILATAADSPDLGHERDRRARRRGDGPADHGVPVADAPGVGRGARRSEPTRQQGGPGAAGGCGAAPADADRRGLQGHRELPAGRDAVWQRERDDADGCGPAVADWGRFTPAVQRWEHATGRPAPRAVDDQNRLSPPFVEWLMGLPAGHVTGVPDLTRTQQLHALGNGVVPQQATAALRLLASRIRMEAAA